MLLLLLRCVWLHSKMEVEKKLCEVEPSSSLGFNISVVVDGFEKCKDGDLHLDEYIKAYEELCIFFGLLGSVFTFITADVKDKIEILRKFRNGHDEREKYEKVEQMMEHEIDVNKKTKKALLGSRTLLRLHRALSFTMLFMEKLSNSPNNEKASSIAANAYTETLAKFHPWLIRKAATFAMYTLPSRGDMLVMVAKDLSQDEVQSRLKNCVIAIRPVYEEIDRLYSQYELHGLP